MSRTHFVYEAYDADGALLYVGCTGNPGRRYKEHMAGSYYCHGWFDRFVTHWHVSGPYPKEAALAIEKQRISEKDPIWNGHAPSNRGPRSDRANHPQVEAYLAHHGVRFERNYGGRPLLVAVVA